MPAASAVIVYVCPSTTNVTVALASEVPVNVGVVSLVPKSVTTGASGAVVSSLTSVTVTAIVCVVIFPAASVITTSTLNGPELVS